MEFLRVMAGPEYQKMATLQTGRIASNKTAAADPELGKAVPELAVFGQIAANEPASALPVYPKNGPKIWEAWYKIQDIALVSDGSIAEALQAGQKKQRSS